MQFLWLFIIFVCAAIRKIEAQCVQVYANGVSSRDAQLIVNKHNDLRRQIIAGKVPGQPRGVNLKTMKYDANLAAAAQRIANSCVFAHQKVKDNRWSVGQNLGMSLSSAPSNQIDWSGIIQSWFNEYKSYKFGQCCSNNFAQIGHYTQVVWGSTEYVGCGYTYFKDSKGQYDKLYVCNYGPAGNIVGQVPYQRA